MLERDHNPQPAGNFSSRKPSEALNHPARVSALIDELTYCSYRHNRKLSPETTPEQWKAIFGPATEAMELRLQKERRILLYDCQGCEKEVPKLYDCDGQMLCANCTAKFEAEAEQPFRDPVYDLARNGSGA